MTIRLLALLTACASTMALAAPRVEVVYVDAAGFADVRNGYTQTPQARDFHLGELRRFVEQQAAARLADDDVLHVTITNVHLAGDYLARHPQATNMRVVREVTPARIDLRFRLTRAGTLLREGTRALRGTGYPVALFPSDPLNYEKMLVEEWLAADLPPPP